MSTKLNQIIAIEKGVKSRHESVLTELYKKLDKASLFYGLSKTWQKTNEELDEDRPPEKKRVQLRVEEALEAAAGVVEELLDVTARKDFGNCDARADVVVDGRAIVQDAPVTYLLFLEKELDKLGAFVSRLPVLTPDEDWQRDQALGLWRTEPTVTQSTKKVQRPLVLYPATEKHAAQTQIITEDVVAGQWNTVKHSGAITPDRKKTLVRRVQRLKEAVKMAREDANSKEAPDVRPGGAFIDYLFGE